MNRIGKFERVSYEKFEEAYLKNIGKAEDIRQVYNSIALPKRGTKGSAGYDFVSPTRIVLMPSQSVVIPTGIRARIDDGWMLAIVPRSGLGFKYGVKLANTIGIIDSDFYYSDSEGQIMVKLMLPDGNLSYLEIQAGERFAQGIFLPYGITVDDETTEIRNGGFGSTGK